MGGLDMFKTTGARANWTKPENLKSPFNSSKDDFAILFSDLDGETGLPQIEMAPSELHIYT